MNDKSSEIGNELPCPKYDSPIDPIRTDSVVSDTIEIQRLKLQLFATGRFKTIEYINSGSFGHVYSAYDESVVVPSLYLQRSANDPSNYDERSVKQPNCAIKVEKNSEPGRLQTEHQILQKLHAIHSRRSSQPLPICDKRVYGFPRSFMYGRLTQCRYLSMDLLGDNLSTLLKQCGGVFTDQTIMMIALQSIERLKDLHFIGYLHRDIKPENMIIGRTESTKSIVYLIDFGLAKSFNEQSNHTSRVGMAGTLRYASVYTIAGERQSFRDDMISLTYCLSLFAHGKLPWQGIKLQGKSGSVDFKKMRREKILKVKLATSLQELCNKFPPELIKVVEHIHSLDFFTMPTYLNYMNLIKEYFDRQGKQSDFTYDWNK